MEVQTLTNKVMADKKLIYVMQGSAREKVLDIYHLILATTYNCNLQCKHCYLPDHSSNILSKDIVLKLVDEWSEIVWEERGKWGGIFHIKGGEPFVVPYLWNILDRVAKLRTLQLMLTTNGTFVDKEILTKLTSYNNALDGHLTVIVSLDGATTETNAMIRDKWHYDKVIRFIQGLKSNNINFYLNCVLHRGNISEISEYLNIAKEFGATLVNFLNLIPNGNGYNLRDWQLPHLDLYERLEKHYKNNDEQTKMMLIGSLPDIRYRETCKDCPTSGECVAAYRGLLYIIPDGSVFTCPNVTYPDTCLGNVLHQNLKDIMENGKRLYDRLKLHNGTYICTGEKMLYERNGDAPRLKSLLKFQGNLKKTEASNLHSMSYCFNRNF